MLRGYGGVAIIWRENIDHLIKILPDGAERIQCVEINSNNDTKLLVASVYLPSKGSHDYVDEFYDCIDQLYQIYHPVKMTIMLHHDIKNLKEGKNSNIRLKLKWEKVDIDLYKALTDQSIDALNKTIKRYRTLDRKDMYNHE